MENRDPIVFDVPPIHTLNTLSELEFNKMMAAGLAQAKANQGADLNDAYEANIFASQASLPDDAILEYIENGFDIQQIARAMCSDINLIALKVDTLIAQGYQLRKQEHQNDFLKYNHKM